MSDKFKNSKFYQTMKNPKVARAIYISLVVMLVATAVIIGIVAASNRSKKGNEGETPSTNPPTQQTQPTPEDTTPSTPDTSGNDTDAGVNEEPNETPVINELPTFSLPVSGKLIKYHNAKVQVFSNTMNDYRVHLGVDIATAADAPVYAAADGKIQKIWKDTLMGYCIAVAHSGDSVTIYKNLKNTLPEGIAEGVKVKAGQQIASVGDSAMIEVAEEPHLHFEMTVAGIQTDPLKYYSATDLESLSVDSSYGE